MKDIGPGVREIRLHIEGEYRVFYVASFVEAIYVLHSFHKKTQKTTKRDMGIGKARYDDIVNERNKRLIGEKKAR